MTRRRRRRTRSLPFPPRLLPAESDIAAANYALAYGYVARQGWRFENIIDREEQIAECLAKLCELLPKHDADKARLSTFAYTCFFRHLAGLAKRRARVVVVSFADVGPEWEPSYSVEPGEECE